MISESRYFSHVSFLTSFFLFPSYTVPSFSFLLSICYIQGTRRWRLTIFPLLKFIRITLHHLESIHVPISLSILLRHLRRSFIPCNSFPSGGTPTVSLILPIWQPVPPTCTRIQSIQHPRPHRNRYLRTTPHRPRQQYSTPQPTLTSTSIPPIYLLWISASTHTPPLLLLLLLHN